LKLKQNFRLCLAITFITSALIACGSDTTNLTNNSGVNVCPTGSICPQNIAAIYGIPGNSEDLKTWAEDNNVPAMRNHSWNLWAGMTANSNSTYLGAYLPVWETWCGTQEVFVNQNCDSFSEPSRSFISATQLTHNSRAGIYTAQTNTQIVSYNKYNPTQVTYLSTPHVTNGVAYDYRSGTSLAALNASWPAGTLMVDRNIVNATYIPTKNGIQGQVSIETKPVFFLIKRTGLTAVPLWQGTSDSWNTANPSPETWKTCILIDPNNSSPSSTAPVPYDPAIHRGAINRGNTDNGVNGQTPGCVSSKYLYAPMSTLYTFILTAQAASSFNVAQGATQASTAEAGDYSALVSMHVGTKELKDWTWQTFYWQPGADTPNQFPGSKMYMTNNVTGPYRNFATCTSWSRTNLTPCFSPYLETYPGIPVGTSSNCFSCHTLAAIGGPPHAGIPNGGPLYPSNYLEPITPNSPIWNNVIYTHTDAMWSINQNALPPAAVKK